MDQQPPFYDAASAPPESAAPPRLDPPPLPVPPPLPPTPPPLPVTWPVESVARGPMRCVCDSCGAWWSRVWARCPWCVNGRPVDLSLARPTPVGTALTNIIGLYIILIGMILTIGVAVGTSRHPDISGALVAATIGVAVLVGVWSAAQPRHVLPGLRLPKLKWLGLALVGGLGTSLVALVFLKAVHSLPIPQQRLIEPFRNAGMGLGTVILIVAMAPAVCEEIAFRGIIQSSLATLMSSNAALFVCAAMFAVMHLAPISMPLLFGLGLALCYLRVASGSLLPCMLMHFTHNFMVVMYENWGW